MTLIKSISGIRGTIGGQVGDNLTPVDIVTLTAAFAQSLILSGDSKSPAGKKVVVGRDARLSGPMVAQLVNATLTGMGLDVVDLGLSTTPTVAMAVPNEKAAAGIIITASHNPKQWNALKLLDHQGEFINAAWGAKVLGLAEEGSIAFAPVDALGQVQQKDDYIDWHIQQILALPLVDVEAIRSRHFKVVVDAVNSTGGLAVPRLLEALGVKTIRKIFCEPNGHFPHNPEPLPAHLAELAAAVADGGYDLGIAVDPDVDRLAFVNEDGSMFGEEYTLVAVADYVLQKEKTPAVSNLSSTRALRDVCQAHGVDYFPSAVGEVNVVQKMKEVGAAIGGEGNGGIIYPALHSGRDALVGIALFLSHFAQQGKNGQRKRMSQLKATYPDYHMVKDKVALTEDLDVDQVLIQFKDAYQAKAEIDTTDGVKIDLPAEWIHLRKSNTEPIVRIYCEAKTAEKAAALSQAVLEQLKAIALEIA